MRKSLKRKSVERLSAIFKEGRRMFPKPEFSHVTYLGKVGDIRMFSAKEGVAVGGVMLERNAVWG